MLKIRFVRMGRKHNPVYRLVVVDSRRAPRSGACLENLGNYNPTQKTHNLKEESIKKWISKGAQVSDTAHNLLIKVKIIKGKKINVSKSKKKKKGEETELTEEKKKEGDVVNSEQPDEKLEEKKLVKKEETKEGVSDKKDEKESEPKEDKSKEKSEKQEEKKS